MNEQLMIIGGKRVILNRQYSKIGTSYPRLFIEVSETEYLNFDIFLGVTFPMKKKDFNDWLEDAEEVPAEQYEQILSEVGVDYEKFKLALDNLGKEE